VFERSREPKFYYFSTRCARSKNIIYNMQILKLNNFTKGWVVGDFEPSVIKTKDFEFAVQYFEAGEKHEKHVHKIAREITIIVEGEFLMNQKKVIKGDVLIIEPNEAAEFECLADGATAVIKTPSVVGDKYLV